MTRVALIDGDEIAFVTSAAATKEVDWDGDGDVTKVADAAAAISVAHDTIKHHKERVKADSVIICLSDPNRALFRRALDPTYKASRTAKSDLFWQIVRSLEERYMTLSYPGLEADDVIGINMGSDRFVGIGVTQDKDLKTVPGWLYNPRKDELRKRTVQQADYFWMYQTLTGDPTDGYKGCPKIGDVKAEKILDGGFGLRDWWLLVVDAYQNAGLTEADALRNARLARILRHEDFNAETPAVRLWHPTDPSFIRSDTCPSPSAAPSAMPSQGQSSESPSPSSSRSTRRKPSPASRATRRSPSKR